MSLILAALAGFALGFLLCGLFTAVCLHWMFGGGDSDPFNNATENFE